jgi:hypothetical protein
VKLGVRVRVQEKGGEKRNGIIVEQKSKRTWMVRLDAKPDPERKMSMQVKAIIPPMFGKSSVSPRRPIHQKGYNHIGGIDHNFDAFSESSLKDKDYEYPFFDLLLKLETADCN